MSIQSSEVLAGDSGVKLVDIEALLAELNGCDQLSERATEITSVLIHLAKEDDRIRKLVESKQETFTGTPRIAITIVIAAINVPSRQAAGN